MHNEVVRFRTAVVGVGRSNFGEMYRERDPGRRSEDLGAAALRHAPEGAGLDKADLDGLCLHQVYWRALRGEVPYNIVWVELEEGPMMKATVVGAAKEDIEIGRRVEVVFDPVTSGITIPRFRLT